MVYPSNYAAIDTISPVFQWNPVQGSPFYTILVFDTLADINIGENSITITANIIWGATTDSTSIEYGTPDPSGYYSDFDAPPLMQGITYSWVVLNNYSGTPGMISTSFAGTYSFTINPAASCGAPNLISPANGVTFTAGPITLSWTAVSGANNYLVYLMKKEEGQEQVLGSTTAPLWSASTTNTQINIPAQTILTNSPYEWYIIAIDPTGKGAKSEVRTFYFNTTVTPVEIHINEIIDTTIEPSGVTDVPQAILYIDTISGGYVNLYPYMCDDKGYFSYDLPYGDYKVTIKKEGFTTATYYFTVSSTPINEEFTITRSAYTIRGFVYDDLQPSNPVSGAHIVAYDPYIGTGVSSEANTLGNGSFILYVNTTGIWKLDITKAGYSPTSVTISVSQNDNVFPYNIILNKNKNILTGQVTNENSQGISNALVKASEDGNTSNYYTDYTDSGGNYTINLPDGTWIVTVEKAGFVSPPPVIKTLSGGETKIQNFVMQSQSNLISGDCLLDDLTPLKDVLIRVIPSSGPYYETYTDSSGHYEVSVGPGDYTVRAIKTGYTSDGDKVVSFSGYGETKIINFTMYENGSFVKGIVTIDGTTPLEGTKVTNGIEIVYTNTSGAYTLSMLSGTYTISASKQGYTSDGDKIVTVGPGETINNIDFILSPNASVINGDCKDVSGTAIADATVYAISSNTTKTTQTDSFGNFSLSVDYGTYDVYASKNGYIDSSHIQITLAPGEVSDNNHLVLTYDVGYISGTVKDDAGQSIDNAEVLVFSDSEGITKTTYSDIEGNYLVGIKTGGYSIFARKAGYLNSDLFTGSVDTSNTIQNPDIKYLILTKTAKTIDGYITDANANPLNNVKVVITGKYNTITVYTDGSGYYVANLNGAEDIIQLDIQKSGYISLQSQENFGGNDYITRDYTLQPDYGILAGTINVQAPDTVNAIVSANGITKLVQGAGQSQSFSMELFPGTYDILITQSGYENYWIYSRVISSGNTTNIGSINLNKIVVRTISGNVQDQSLSGIEGATVEIRKNSDDSLVKTVLTDINGNYLADGLNADIYKVKAYKAGYDLPPIQVIDTTGGDAANVNFTLTKNNASIYIYVSDGTLPLYNVEINLEGSNTYTAGYTGSGVTDIYGGLTITAMHEGDYTVYLHKTGYQDTSIAATLYNGQTVSAVAIMTPDISQMGLLTGIIQDENSAPMENIKVEVYDTSMPDTCLLYTSPSPRDLSTSRMPSSA